MQDPVYKTEQSQPEDALGIESDIAHFGLCALYSFPGC